MWCPGRGAVSRAAVSHSVPHCPGVPCPESGRPWTPDRSWGSSSLRADAPASALPPLHSARRGSVSVPRTQCGLGCPPFRRFPLNIVVNSLLKSSKNVLPCAEVSARAECPGRFTVRAADTTRPSVWRGVARSGSRKRTRAWRRRPVSAVRAPPSRRMPRRLRGGRWTEMREETRDTGSRRTLGTSPRRWLSGCPGVPDSASTMSRLCGQPHVYPELWVLSGMNFK